MANFFKSEDFKYIFASKGVYTRRQIPSLKSQLYNLVENLM